MSRNTVSTERISSKLLAARTPLVLAAAVALVVLGMPSAQAATSGDTEHITVTQELEQTTDDQQCMGRSGMKWTRKSLPQTFTIVVTLDRPLCQPVEASAVIYLMPKTDPRWPQTLSEKVEITFLEAGVTTIVWEKYCVPAQFDLLTGPTPQTIAPWGPWHGGLLFPATDLAGSNGSAIQYLGAGDFCSPTTTTTTTTTEPEDTTTTTEPEDTTTTAEPEDTTTTTEAQVGGTTTTLVEQPSVSPQPSVTVGGTTATNTNSTSRGGAPLSVTG